MRHAAAGVLYEFAKLLFVASTFCPKRCVPKGTGKVAAVPATGARGPLPDDEALKNGAYSLAATTVKHFDGLGGDQAARRRRGGRDLQLRARARAAGTSRHIHFPGGLN